MPLDAQVKLLRVIQSKEVLPVGAVKPERVDVRIVCATHRDLRKLQRSETFRGDLFARLNEFSLSLPSLRERKEDLLSLCRALAQRHGRSEVRETLLFMTGLLHYDFPFNVRELEALIKRWIALSSEPTLDAEHLTDEIKERMKKYGSHRATPAPMTQDAAEPSDSAPRGAQGEAPSEQELRALLARHQGNIAAVGRELGKDRVQVHRWMRKYGINIDEYR
jgi:DNA-binding NtrC family response regulator